MAERLGGLILAGGRSKRLGREKAVAVWRGEPLIAHVARCFDDCVAVAVSANPVSAAAVWAVARGWPVLPDPEGAPNGPLSGLREGLTWADRLGFDALASAPCDTPALPTDVFARLATMLRPEIVGAVAETADGLEPLIAVWKVKPALRAVEDLLAEGVHPPARALVRSVNTVTLRFEASAQFLNLNRAQDFDAPSEYE